MVYIQTQAEAVRELFGGKKATVLGWLDTGDKMRLAA